MLFISGHIMMFSCPKVVPLEEDKSSASMWVSASFVQMIFVTKPGPVVTGHIAM